MSDFEKFLEVVLEDPAVRASFEDAATRHSVIDTLIRQRKTLGLSQAEVAKRMGVGQSTVAGFEKEMSDPRLSTLQRYARAVGASLSVEVTPTQMPDLPTEAATGHSKIGK